MFLNLCQIIPRFLSPQCWHLLVVFILIEVFLDLVLMSHFQLKSGHFGYYVMRLSNLFNLSVLRGLV